MRGPRWLAILGLFLGWAAAPALAALPEPEEIYRGTAPGLIRGILVIGDAAGFEEAVAPLDPGFGGPPPDFKKRTVLRVTGSPRINQCRDTRLLEVSTRFRTAFVKIEELIPEQGCACPAEAKPPVAWLVSVAKVVRKAELLVTDRVVPCPSQAAPRPPELASPLLILEGSWEAASGAQLVTGENEYKETLKRLGVGERGPAVDFNNFRVAVITGRARENSCRRSKMVGARLSAPEEAEFTIEETYPAKGQMCANIYTAPQVFLYRLPPSVVRVRTVTLEQR